MQWIIFFLSRGTKNRKNPRSEIRVQLTREYSAQSEPRSLCKFVFLNWTGSG